MHVQLRQCFIPTLFLLFSDLKIFVAEPSELVFTDYQVNQTYEVGQYMNTKFNAVVMKERN